MTLERRHPERAQSKPPSEPEERTVVLDLRDASGATSTLERQTQHTSQELGELTQRLARAESTLREHAAAIERVATTTAASAETIARHRAEVEETVLFAAKEVGNVRGELENFEEQVGELREHVQAIHKYHQLVEHRLLGLEGRWSRFSGLFGVRHLRALRQKLLDKPNPAKPERR